MTALRSALALGAVAVGLSACDWITGQRTATLSERGRGVISDWLLCDECSDGELDSVVALRGAAVAPLGNALVGPPQIKRENIQSQAAENYGRAGEFARGAPLPFRLGHLTERAVSNYIALYQTRAAVALGEIDNAAARRHLRDALDNPGNYRRDVLATIRTALAQTLTVVAGDNQGAPVGSTLPDAVTARVLDSHGDGVPGVRVTFIVAQGGGSVSGAEQATDADGRAAVGSWTLGPVPGSNALFATARGLPTDTAFAIGSAVAGLMPIITKLAGDNQTAPVGQSVPVPPSVLVSGGSGTGISGETVDFSVTSGGGLIVAPSIATDAGGVAEVGSWVLGPEPGANTLAALVSAGGSVTFTATGTATSWEAVATGREHSCGLGAGGVAYCWGRNAYGQLGNSSTIDTMLPEPVLTGGRPFAAMSASGGTSTHTCALTHFGDAYCWGLNDWGQLGDSSTTDKASPTAVARFLAFSSVTTGEQHTCADSLGGTLHCWGNNDLGQLGDGSNDSRLVPTPVSGGLSFEHVSAGASHTCGVTDAGRAYCWGSNDRGQLGTGGFDDRNEPAAVDGSLEFRSIAAGRRHSCGVTDDGRAFCWGDNSRGQIGDGSTTDRLAPTAVSGAVVFVSVHAGEAHTCGLSSGGEAYCWGANGEGQLGDGTVDERRTPTPVSGGLSFSSLQLGSSHTCGLSAGDVLRCWGSGAFGQLGNGGNANALDPDRVKEPPSR